MTKNRFDVIVAGGGIAGCYAARELSKAGLKTLLITLNLPLGSTAGTVVVTVEKFLLPKGGITSPIKKVIFGTLKKEKTWITDKNLGYTLNYAKMLKLLENQIVKYQGVIINQARAVSLIKKSTKIIGVKTSKGDYFGQYIIDATGSAGSLISKAGLRKKTPCFPAAGREYVIYDKGHYLSKYQNSISVYLDTQLFPCGYGWVFCNGIDNYKIGVCEYAVNPQKKLPTFDERIKKFLNILLKDKKIKILEKHGGSIYFGKKLKLKQVRYKNLLGVGDAIGSINTLFGEGVRHALQSAEYAVRAIIENKKEEQAWIFMKKNGRNILVVVGRLLIIFLMLFTEKIVKLPKNFTIK